MQEELEQTGLYINQPSSKNITKILYIHNLIIKRKCNFRQPNSIAIMFQTVSIANLHNIFLDFRIQLKMNDRYISDINFTSIYFKSSTQIINKNSSTTTLTYLNTYFWYSAVKLLLYIVYFIYIS